MTTTKLYNDSFTTVFLNVQLLQKIYVYYCFCCVTHLTHYFIIDTKCKQIYQIKDEKIIASYTTIKKNRLIYIIWFARIASV